MMETNEARDPPPRYRSARKSRPWWLLAMGLMVALALGLWWLRPSVRLPSGYRIFFASGSEVYLVDPQDENVIGATLTEINVQSGIIVGRNVPRPGDRGIDQNRPGYFVIEPGTGRLTRGLSREQLEQQLRELGQPGIPPLYPPEYAGPRK
jgi:hypothetical protein